MNILAIDTSSGSLSVLVSIGGVAKGFYQKDCGLTHSEILLKNIDRVLEENKLTLKDFDLFSAVIGPGSFTGIRIGVTTVRAFCQVEEKSAISVNSLEHMAYTTYSARIPVLDAGHGKVYYAAYSKENVEVIPPSVCELSELFDKIKDIEGVLVSELPLAACRKTVIPENPLQNLNACLLQKIQKGEILHYSNLIPLYIRVSQAEEKFK